MYMATLDIADEAEEFDPFADIKEDEDKLEDNKLVLDDCYLYTVYVSLASHTPFTVLLYNIIMRHMHCYRVTRFVDVRMCYSNSSRGYYSRVATIPFNTSGGIASIREQ